MRLDLIKNSRGWIFYRYRGIPFAFWTGLLFEVIDNAQADLFETLLSADGDGPMGIRSISHWLALSLDGGSGGATIKVNYQIEGRAPTKAIKYDSTELLGYYGVPAAELLAVRPHECPEPQFQAQCLCDYRMIWQIHNMPIELESPRGEWPPVEIARSRLNREPRWQDLDQGQRGWAVSGRQSREANPLPPRPWASSVEWAPETPEQMQAAIDAELDRAFGAPRSQTIQDLQAQRDAVRARAIAEARTEPVTKAIGTLSKALIGESAQGLLSLEGNPVWNALKEAATALQEAIAETQSKADANMGLVDIKEGGLFR